MRRVILFFTVLIAAIFPTFSTEPSIVLALALPGFIQISEFESASSYSLSELSEEETFMITLPKRCIDNNMRLASAFSYNPLRLGAFAWDIYGIYSAIETYSLTGNSSGSLNIERSIDYENGELHIAIDYDNIKASYLQDRKTESLSIDGKVNLTISVFIDELISIKIETEDIVIPEDRRRNANGEVEIILYAKENAFDQYMRRSDWNIMRAIAVELLKQIAIIDWSELGLSYHSTSDEFIAFAETHGALDLINTLTVFVIAIAEGGETTDILDTFSNIIDPVMYINGERANNIRLSRAVDVTKLVLGFIT